MKTLPEVLVDAQAVVASLQALVDAQTPALVVVEDAKILVVKSDGTQTEFVPVV